MKKFLLITFVIGLILCIIGSVGTYYYTFVDNQYHKEDKTIRKSYPSSNIKSINIDAYNTDLSLKKGSQLQVYGTFDRNKVKLDTTVKDGTLYINVNQNKSRPGINVNPFYLERKKELYIQVPERLLEQVHIKGEGVSSEIDGIKANQFDVDVQSGYFDIVKSSLKHMNIKLNKGAFDVETSSFESMNIDNRFGVLDLMDIPKDIPMQLKNDKGTVSVGYRQPLEDTIFKVNNDKGEVDLEAIDGIHQNKVGTGHQTVIIENRYGYIDFYQG